MKNFLYKNKFNILLAGFFLFLSFFRLHNAINFNPYWGYDGGAHLDYAKTVLQEKRLPTIQENYLAWHEPYFYVAYAAVGQILHYFAGGENYDFYELIVKYWQFLSAIINVLIVYLIYKISKLFTSDKKVHLASIIGSGLISVMTETSNYLTNELLLAFFIILLFYYFITFSKNHWNFKKIIIIAILCGAALLTKLSALIFILSLIIWFVYRTIYLKQKKWLGYLFLILIISAIIYSPWAVYKQKNIGRVWSTNTYEDRQKSLSSTMLYQNVSKKLPSGFFYKLNPQIFNNPFWMNSGNSFWTIIFADVFSDYFMVSNNIDKNNLQPSHQQKILTDSGNYVSFTKFRLSILLLYFSIFFVLMFICSTLGILWRVICQQLKPLVNLLLLIFIFGSFLALADNIWQYPALERGTLKASFILPVWSLLMVIGFSWLSHVLKKIKAEFLWLPVWFIIIIWATLSVMINWI